MMQILKLRTYCTYKSIYEAEPYVYRLCNRAHRSILAQFRTGILHIKLNTGTFNQIPLELRLCILCEDNATEHENTFILNVVTKII